MTLNGGIAVSTHRAQLATAMVFAATFACWTASATVAADPPIKLSRNGICHERGTSAYAATLQYEPFETLADCLKAGGRAPKNKHARPTAAPPASTATHAHATKVDRPSRTDGWNVWRRLAGSLSPYFGIGVIGALALLWQGGRVIRRRWREYVQRRRYRRQEREAVRRWRAHRREGPKAADGASTDTKPTSIAVPESPWDRWRRYRRATAEERELLAACMNDREVAERLIDYEIDHDSTLTHQDAVTAALQRYRRDNT